MVILHAVQNISLIPQLCFVILKSLLPGNVGDGAKPVHFGQIILHDGHIFFGSIQLHKDHDLILLAHILHDAVYIDAEQNGKPHDEQAGDQRAYRSDGHHAVIPKVFDAAFY